MYKFISLLLLFCLSISAQEVPSYFVNEKVNFLKTSRSGKLLYPGDENIDVTYYKLKIRVDHINKQISGEVTINLKFLSPASSFFFDFDNNMIVLSVYGMGDSLEFDHADNKILITLNRNISADESYSVIINYFGSPASTGFGSFAFDTHNETDPVIWTLSEPYGARDWFPCKDTPADKADSSEVWITSSNFFTAVSNGTLQEIINNADGTRTFIWKNHYPIANYLISIAMTNYTLIKDYFKYSETDSMAVENYVYPQSYNYAAERVGNTITALKIYSELFGPYPWLDEKYGHAQCGFGGGMEHQTIASVGGFEESLIVHELAHQWFGDKLTCKNWNNIWLNEGFATYAEALYSEKKYGKDQYNSLIDSRMQRARNVIGSIYLNDISTTDKIFYYDKSYLKASLVLHMLRGVVGDSLFFKILKTYANHPDLSFGVVTTEDFRKVAEDVFGSDLKYFFDEWIYGENYPKYTIHWTYSENGPNLYKLDFVIDQETNSNPQFFTMPVQVKITTTSGDTLFTLFNNQKKQEFILEVKGMPLALKFDPDHLILKEVFFTADTQSNGPKFTYRLLQNYPNPFNPNTTISYYLPNASYVRLKIFNVQGREILQLVNQYQTYGQKEILFSPADYDISSGIYFYQITAENLLNGSSDVFIDVKKMIILK